MKDLTFYVAYAKSILNDLGIPYKDYPVSVNQRLTGKWGRCITYYNNSGNNRIELNPVLIMDTTNDDALMDTLLHEYIHTCPGCDNHGKVFKYYANIINTKYHYHIKRTTSAAEKGLDNTVLKPDAKYRVECPQCHRSWGYLRNSSVVKCARDHKLLKCICGYSGRDFILR